MNLWVWGFSIVVDESHKEFGKAGLRVLASDWMNFLLPTDSITRDM